MYKGRGRGKKALRTPLGTAPSSDAGLADLSSLRRPIETSLLGLKQVLGLFETATEEVKDYISYECELIYECRTCRSMFRSLANFILHKREYCKGRYTGWCRNRGDDNIVLKPSPPPPPHPVEISPKQSSPPDVALKDSCQKSLAAVISKLEARQRSEEICASAMEADSPVREEKGVVPGKADVALQGIEDSLSGVFQTLVADRGGGDEEDLIKTEVMEIHSILNNDEVILGPDGKAIARQPEPSAPAFDLVCKMCRQRFSTKKTLTQHIKYKHNATKVVYLCPEAGCSGSIFANTWSVFRHLYKVHRKTSAQVKKMRALIQSNVLRRGQVVEKQVCHPKGKGKKTTDEENIEWMDSFECDNDLQMCGGCGKRFERKAALISHSQLCQRRRLAVGNTHKSEEEDDDDDGVDGRPEIPKLIIKDNKVVGARKRKNAHTVRKTEANVGSIYEPEMILVEAPQVVCVSDEEEESTLEMKAAPFMNAEERRCLPCNHPFETSDALLKHMATHFKWFRFQCDECLFKSYDRPTLRSHLLKHHAISDAELHTVRLTHHEIVKSSVDFQPLFEGGGSERRAVCADPSVQKMIMEVIFGSIPGLHEAQRERPVRNRVAPKKDDFVYEDDVHNFPDTAAAAADAGKPVKTYSKKRRLLEEYKP